MSNTNLITEELANGLKIICDPKKESSSCSLGFFVKTGSRDEVEKESGVSHFLEHMMFKGTKKRSALDISYELGNLGAQANAYTSEEITVYYATVIPKFVEPMQALLSDMLRPSLDIKEFDMEKKVILEEIALYQDRPQFYLFEHAFGDYFSGHTAGNSVLGTHESVSSITQPVMKDYFSRRYSPSNLVFVATGKIDVNDVIERAKKFCGNWEGPSVSREVSRFKQENSVKKAYTKADISQTHILLVCEGCAAQDQERYPLALLSYIVGDYTGSKLYWDLVHSGLAESISADSDERDGAGCFYLYASTNQAHHKKVKEILCNHSQQLLDFNDKDLERAKNKLATRMVRNGELPMGRMISIGTEWTYQRTYNDLRDELNNIKAVEKADIKRALEKFDFKTWSEFTLLPAS